MNYPAASNGVSTGIFLIALKGRESTLYLHWRARPPWRIKIIRARLILRLAGRIHQSE